MPDEHCTFKIVHRIHEMVAIEVPSKYFELWTKYVDNMYNNPNL